MKIQIDAGLFAGIAATAAEAIGAKPMKPEWECVYVEARSESGSPIMTVTATDGGIAIKKSTDQLIAVEDGYALIPAKTLLAFLKIMKGDLTMEVGSDLQCRLKCGNKRSTISCMNADDYDPEFPFLREEKTAVMDGCDFERMVQYTSHCVGNDTGRMILTGIHFAFDGEKGNCEAAALDGFRMALVRKGAETNDTFSVTVPSAAAKLAAKILRDKKGVSFRFGSGLMIAEAYDTAFKATLLQGEYIDISHLMVRDGKMRVKANAAEMLEAVRLAMISANEHQKGLVVLNFVQEDIMSVLSNSDASSANAAVPCVAEGEIEGGESEIAFNGKYVEEALKNGADFAEETTLLINTAVSPMAVIPVGREDYYQLVLPVRRLAKE